MLGRQLAYPPIRPLKGPLACALAGCLLALFLIWPIGHCDNALADPPLPNLDIASAPFSNSGDPVGGDNFQGDSPQNSFQEGAAPPIADLLPPPAEPQVKHAERSDAPGLPTERPQPPPYAIGGQYRVMFNAANFAFHPPDVTDAQKSQTFFNQRFRTWLTVAPNENVGAYLQVQMGHNLWGEQFEFVKANVAPLFPVGDRVGIALRRAYLSYRNDGLGELRLGVQDWQDMFGQTLASADWDFNVGGLLWERPLPRLGDARMRLGWFALSEGDVQLADDALLVALDVAWQPSDQAYFGLAA